MDLSEDDGANDEEEWTEDEDRAEAVEQAAVPASQDSGARQAPAAAVDEAREPVGRTGRARGAPPETGPPGRRKQPRATVAECLGEGSVPVAEAGAVTEVRREDKRERRGSGAGCREGPGEDGW